jgi:integrase
LNISCKDKYPIEKHYKGLIVIGKVNSQKKCPKCALKFTADHRDEDGFFCPIHLTRPTRYYLDCTAFVKRTWRIYKDPTTEKVFKNYSDALDVLIAMNRDHKEGKFKSDKWVPEKIAEKRFESIIPTWLRNYEIELGKDAKSKTRVHQLTVHCRDYILPFFTGKDIREPDQIFIERFYHGLLDECQHREILGPCPFSKGIKDDAGQVRYCPSRFPLSSRYIKDILDTLKAIFLRYRTGDMPKIPVIKVVPSKAKQLLGLAREISTLDKVPDRHGYRTAILVLLRTGMRNNECSALKVSDLVDGIIYVSKAISAGKLVNTRKSGPPKTYRVTPELWDLLLSHVEGKDPDDFIFEINGNFIRPNRLYKVWMKACQDAGVKHISLQQASRHSTATEIKKKHDKAAAREIMEQLGHENTSTGKHYIADGQSNN